MIDHPASDLKRGARLIIADNGPMSVLSNLGEALDWLFVPRCEVWMTDMVLIEARRPWSPDGRSRKMATATFNAWFERNRYRIKVLTTPQGERHARAMQLWELAGRPEGLEPESADLGEESIVGKLRAVRTLIGRGEAAIVVMDDRDGRAAVKALRMDIDLMGTQTFVKWMSEDYHVTAAETAWVTLKAILRDELDEGESDDPVFIRNAAP